MHVTICSVVLFVLQYVITVDSLDSFCTTHPSNTNYGVDLGITHIDQQNDSLLIGVVGDWGVLGQNDTMETTNYQVPDAIGNALNEFIINNSNLSFIINNGDNFYNDGITSISDKRWNITFNTPFHQTQQTARYFYSVLGNHDYSANSIAYKDYPNNETKWDIGTTTQILYTSSHYNYLKNWCFPNYYYTFSYHINNNLKVKFIAIDSQSLLQYQYNGCQPDPNDPNKTSSYCQGESTPNISDQLEWLNETLSNSTAYDYVVVYSHQFLVSQSEHGLQLNNPVINPVTNQNQCVRADAFGGYPTMARNITDIIANYDNVRIYLAGHGHTTELFKGYRLSNNISILQTVIGRSGRTDSVICGNQTDIDQQYNDNIDYNASIKWTNKYGSVIPAFGTVLFEKHKLSVTLYDTNQNVLWREIEKINQIPTTEDEADAAKDENIGIKIIVFITIVVHSVLTNN